MGLLEALFFMIPILQETQHWLAVHKAAEISVHNDPGADLISLLNQQLDNELYPINRLDVGTSGIVLIGKTKEAAAKLGELISSRETEKRYLAICQGTPKGQEGWNSWTQSLSKKAEGRKNPRGISRDRVPCETRWHIKETIGRLSLLEIHLVTGRKHQIRRHFALAKCPLVGDSRYGGKAKEGRLGLHAFSLSFIDPFSSTEVQIECSPPDSFLKLFN